jgi:2-polyprenyl-6-methoxyphenol hydroxylase-like FAD-dependent oxidoreductase
MSEHYQAIIIGGRKSGASLAIWRGRRHIKTLLVDRATFSSLPSVPFGPIIYNQHMDMLEELGIPEDELFYADGRRELTIQWGNSQITKMRDEHNSSCVDQQRGL